MSLRISVKDGLIHGMQEFAIQKPGSRQFPYDTTFHNINNQLERLSAIRQEFFNITLNGESWGVMNAEPVIDEKFLELQEVKRLGIFVFLMKKDQLILEDGMMDVFKVFHI